MSKRYGANVHLVQKEGNFDIVFGGFKTGSGMISDYNDEVFEKFRGGDVPVTTAYVVGCYDGVHSTDVNFTKPKNGEEKAYVIKLGLKGGNHEKQEHGKAVDICSVSRLIESPEKLCKKMLSEAKHEGEVVYWISDMYFDDIKDMLEKNNVSITID